jgi:hypothetical protein|tara:strand:+ start:265 stop:501 length:237 start_codon:yes stop_codon:yes gene_type:complete
METTKKRRGPTIPFGYKLDKDNNKILVSIPLEIEALEEIIALVKERVLSLREGSLWLEHKTGRKLSHQGLKKIITKHG